MMIPIHHTRGFIRNKPVITPNLAKYIFSAISESDFLLHYPNLLVLLKFILYRIRSRAYQLLEVYFAIFKSQLSFKSDFFDILSAPFAHTTPNL
jgi:hypothetical protein